MSDEDYGIMTFTSLKLVFLCKFYHALQALGIMAKGVEGRWLP